MILGKGGAQTEDEIIREYHQFLLQKECCSIVLDSYRRAPETMLKRIGKPLNDWEDTDILALFKDRGRGTGHFYCSFLAFLFFYGYRRASINFLSQLPTTLCRMHKEALLPIRQHMEETHKELKYAPRHVGNVLNRLIWLLAVTGKPLNDLTRVDFEVYRDEYQAWFLSRNLKGTHDKRLVRVERYLIHWNILQPKKRIFKHDEYFNSLRHKHIRNAILEYINWYETKSAPSSVNSRRVGLIKFFLWFQEEYPDNGRLDDVNRKVALEYAQLLHKIVESNGYAIKYGNDLYRDVRLLYDFAIFERLTSSPNRNPFSLRDMPKRPNSLPRYIPDHQMKKVLDYCKNGATLLEKTVVIILLHTGIRAFELANLCTKDIVQIQGVWKLHIREGKGLKDRLIPLTSTCLKAIQEWQEFGWERINENLFTRYGIPWASGAVVCTVIREMRRKIGISGITPHRFRHTFAVALLNHGLRESALQKLMGHSTLDMTLEYGRILDKTVELSFNQTVRKMQESPMQLVPNFFKPEEYKPFTQEDAINWIRLPHGYCRRHPKMHCESDVKCLLCDRYCAHSENLECLEGMHKRYLELNMSVQADVVYSHVAQLKDHSESKIQNIHHERIAVS